MNAREVPLVGKHGQVALVSECDFAMVSEFNWYAVRKSRTFYVHGVPKEDSHTTLQLHRFILKPPPGVYVDHIDENGLNNTRENLRLCTPWQNSARAYRPGGKHGFRGIEQFRSGRYRACVKHLGHRYASPAFDTLEEAAREYDKIAHRLFGEFAKLNFPDEVVS